MIWGYHYFWKHPYIYIYINTYLYIYIYEKFSKVVMLDKRFKGVTQVNSSNPIGSASKTARFGASVFVKEFKKGQHLVLR